MSFSQVSLLEALGRAAAIFNNATGTLPCFTLPSDPNYDGIWDYQWCTYVVQGAYGGRDFLGGVCVIAQGSALFCLFAAL